MPGKRKCKYKEVAEALKNEIIAKHEPGYLLPSERKLSEKYSVSYMTLRQSLALLASEGLVERHHGRGTIVADRMAAGEVAIVVISSAMDSRVISSYHLLCSALASIFEEHKSPYKVKIHLGNSMVPGYEFPGTLDILEPHVLSRLRGVFSFHPLHEVESKLLEAHVPVVHWGSSGQYRINSDTETFCCNGITHLVESGCRNICLLTVEYAGARPGPGSARLRRDTTVASRSASEHGVAFRNESIPYGVGGFSEQHGYDLFMRMWEGPDRPDGVFVFDEILCAGVLRAVSRLGLKLPDDLCLISQATRGLRIPYHTPVTRIEYDMEEQARLAVGMMESLLRGDLPKQNKIEQKGTLVKGKTT